MRRNASRYRLNVSELHFPHLLAPQLPLFSRFLQFLIAPGPDGLRASLQLVPRRHLADAAVQADPIVMVHIARYRAPRPFRGVRCTQPLCSFALP